MKLKSVVTKRKTLPSGEERVLMEKHVVTATEIFAEVMGWNGKPRKENKWKESQVVEEPTEESETSDDELLVVLDCKRT
jgi:hypothetical protein